MKKQNKTKKIDKVIGKQLGQKKFSVANKVVRLKLSEMVKFEMCRKLGS